MWSLVTFAIAAKPQGEPVETMEPVEIESSELSVDSPGRYTAPSRGSATCVMRVVVELNGKVSEAEAVGCPPEFAAAAERGARTTRYANPKVDGERVRVATQFVVHMGKGPMELPTREHTVLDEARVAGEPCVIQATVYRNGGVDELHTNEPGTCATFPGWVPKKAFADLEQRTACSIRFETRRGMLAGIRVEECPEPLFRHTEKMSRAWRWSDEGEGQVYLFTAVYQP